MAQPRNYIEIEEACNYLWVTTKEIMTILGGVSKKKADEFRMQLEKKLNEEKLSAEQEENETKKIKLLAQCFYYDDTKPHRLPIKRVLEEAHVDLDYIRREANKMRKAQKIELERVTKCEEGKEIKN